MIIHPAIIERIKKNRVQKIRRKVLNLPAIEDVSRYYDRKGADKKKERGIVIIDPKNSDFDAFKKFRIYWFKKIR